MLRMRMMLLVLTAAMLTVTASMVAQGQTSVNVTNGTVYVSFSNATVISFTTTRVNLGWVNESFIGCAYSCLYAYSPEECHTIRVKVFDGTTLVYEVLFEPSENNTDLCPPSLKGICVGYTVFNVSNFTDTARILVIDETEGVTRGPFDFTFPYTGPTLTGYARYIPVIVPYGVLISLAGRLGMKNVGIGLIIYGLITPALTVLGVAVKNLMLVSSISVILGLVLIWMSNQ